jgi:hypothetical protein
VEDERTETKVQHSIHSGQVRAKVIKIKENHLMEGLHNSRVRGLDLVL